jgi:hypothetical protein
MFFPLFDVLISREAAQAATAERMLHQKRKKGQCLMNVSGL